MLPLFKYSLSETMKSLDAKEGNYIIKLQKGRSDPTHHPCIFFATDGKMDAYEAHDYLAITYYPRSCFKCDLTGEKVKIEDNIGTQIVEADLNIDCDYNRARRCWPSFGHPGGAREVILIDDSESVALGNLVMTNTFPDGGETDEFHQDNTANYDLKLALEIAKMIIPIFEYDDYSFTLNKNDNRGITIGSFKSGSGLSLNRSMVGKSISISTGFNVYGSSMQIKMWATVWKDDESNRKRYIYGPLEREITFSFLDCKELWQDSHGDLKHVILELITHKKYPYFELSDSLKELIKRSLQITDNFFCRMAKTYPLPYP